MYPVSIYPTIGVSYVFCVYISNHWCILCILCLYIQPLVYPMYPVSIYPTIGVSYVSCVYISNHWCILCILCLYIQPLVYPMHPVSIYPTIGVSYVSCVYISNHWCILWQNGFRSKIFRDKAKRSVPSLAFVRRFHCILVWFEPHPPYTSWQYCPPPVPTPRTCISGLSLRYSNWLTNMLPMKSV